jgi:hypothetical protein
MDNPHHESINEYREVVLWERALVQSPRFINKWILMDNPHHESINEYRKVMLWEGWRNMIHSPNSFTFAGKLGGNSMPIIVLGLAMWDNGSSRLCVEAFSRPCGSDFSGSWWWL